MNKHDYGKLGFKAGLEIHQQLSGRKLFCSCPADIREDEPSYAVTRTLRASVGESGETDIAAAHEQRKQKQYIYHGYQDTTCLRELDEEPVSAPNPEAVETAVIVSKLLGMTLADQVHVMRKVVVDGSNTSGFQRTMLVSFDGKLDDVRIDRLCLEEDSCKIVERGTTQDTYNLSRLGIPLLEITTKPDITSPQHLQDTAASLGMVLRSTGRVKRGLGTIRQDVNISIAKGARVEIKGVQALDLIPELAENEVQRQLALVEIAENNKTFELRYGGKDFDCMTSVRNAKGWLGKAVKSGQSAVGLSVVGAAGLFGKELYAGYRVGTELAGYAKVWGFGGIIHSDEDPKKYGLVSWDAVRKAFKCSEKDAFLFLVGEREKIEACIGSVLTHRIRHLAEGVPSEVRKANDDGTTTYLRPMPGAARMYPETDVKTFRVDHLDPKLPELITDRIPRMAKRYKISADAARMLIRSGRADLFEAWADKVDAKTVYDVLVVKEKEIKKRHKVDVDVDHIATQILERLQTGAITASSIEPIMVASAGNKNIDWDAYRPVDERAVRRIVQGAVRSDPKAPFGALMGDVMKKLGGKADGKLVSKLLTEELGK